MQPQSFPGPRVCSAPPPPAGSYPVSQTHCSSLNRLIIFPAVPSAWDTLAAGLSRAGPSFCSGSAQMPPPQEGLLQPPGLILTRAHPPGLVLSALRLCPTGSWSRDPVRLVPRSPQFLAQCLVHSRLSGKTWVIVMQLRRKKFFRTL